MIPEPEPEVAQQPEVNKAPEFVQIYCGSARAYDARNLDPASTYLFRVCAVNSAGPSEWSPNREITTMAAPPAVVTNLQVRTKSLNYYLFKTLSILTVKCLNKFNQIAICGKMDITVIPAETGNCQRSFSNLESADVKR